ncbi:MXAN_6577-like cysteine-rich protein [Sandaracinus amylolyticus]|uniref:MXAN_6577-like cysteine-rich protein n=1 Tax=Sandaracinus amylolyticus TaxID=927083 RepID=UPI001F2C1890|nr:MXAN_6577-like cysteine-rich protein [Sandaracinus amylolyticus]
MLARTLWIGVALALALAGCGDDADPTPDAGDVEIDAQTPRTDSGPPECTDGTTLCGDECVDTSGSRANCGSCGNACAAGEACVDGACDVLCPASQTECGDVCADVSSDRAHCGECGTACDAGEICVDGSCTVSCPAGQILCGDVCADLQSSHANCGECGNACAAGAVCNAGDCTTTCSESLTACDGSCVQPQTSPDHCGACGNACAAVDGATPFCAAGQCRFACDALQGDCNGSATDGCETSLATDAQNCGACGLTCEVAGGVAACSAGACTIASCDAGHDDCDGLRDNGCEANLGADELNCGACGTVCGATEECVGATCVTTGVGAGVGDTCSAPFVLAAGTNTLVWEASSNDYVREPPACMTSTTNGLHGPDIVMSYTAPTTQRVVFTLSKGASSIVAGRLTTSCGDEATEIGCLYSSSSGTTTPTDPLIVMAGQTVYLHVVDVDSTSESAPLPNPMIVEVTATEASCAPGVGGILGTSTARTPTGLASFTEYFMELDDSHMYVGGTGNLYRMPRGGGPVEDIEALAALAATHLGYAMAIDGDDIYVVEAPSAANIETNGHLFRISRDGGATWSIQDYAVFTPEPSDDFRATAIYGNKVYLLTEEDTSLTATEIWSVDLDQTGTPAVVATRERQLVDSRIGDCSGLARDSTYFYIACAETGGDYIFRIPVAGGAPEVVTNALDVGATVNALRGDDIDGDGVFDALYLQNGTDQLQFVCSPTGASPFGGPFTGIPGVNYGMTFDSTAGVLWTFDDGTREFISVQ